MPIDPVKLDNRLHAVWERLVALELALYDANANWSETLPVSAPRDLRRMVDGHLAIACELDAIARDLEAETKRFEEIRTDMAKGLVEVERDGLTRRFGEIVQMQRQGEDKEDDAQDHTR